MSKMKLKGMLSKIVAILCTVALLMGLFQMPVFQTEAATESGKTNGYDLVTLSELTDNYESGTVTAKTTFTKCSALTWEGTVFEGNFTFDYTGNDEGNMLLLGHASSSRGLKIFINKNDQLQIRLVDNGNSGGKARAVDQFVTASDLGVDSLKSELELKINFDFTNPNEDTNTADVVVRVQIDDYCVSLTQTAFQLEYMKRVAWLQGTTSCPLYHNSQFENAYDLITFSDLANSDADKSGTTNAKKNLTKCQDMNLDNTMFEGYVTFTGTTEGNGMVVFGQTNGRGLKVFLKNETQLQLRLIESGTSLKDDFISAADLGFESFVNQKLHLKASFDFKDVDIVANTADVTVTVQINGCEKVLRKTDFPLDYMKRVVWLVANSTYGLTYDNVEHQDLTFTDFGFDETTTAEAGVMKYKDQESIYDHVTVEGNYVFSKAKESNIVIFGKQWYGVRFLPDGKGNLVVSHSGLDADKKAVTKQMGIIYAEDIGYNLVDTAIKMKTIFTLENISADGTTADVIVGVVINDSYRRAYRAETIAIDTILLGLFVYADGSANPFTVSTNELLPSHLIEVSPADFGIADKCYKAEDQASLKAMGVKGELSNKYTDASGKMTLDGKVFSANVKFASANSQLSIGGVNASSWYGFSLIRTSTGFKFQSNSAKWCAMTAVTIDPIVAGLTSADDAFNLKISCEFEDSNSDTTDDCIKFGVWFNDKLYNNTYVYTESIPADIGCGAFICCQSEGGFIDIATEEQVRDDITPYILEEFGVETTTHHSPEVLYTKDMSKYDTSMVKGKIALTGNAWMSVYSLKVRSGLGVRFYNNGGTLAVRSYIRKNDDSANLTCFNFAIPTVAEGEIFEFGVSREILDLDMDGSANDVRLGIWINGELYNKQYYYLLDCAQRLEQSVTLSPGTGSISVQDTVVIDSYNLANDEGYLISGKGELSINGAACANGKLINAPGDYIVRSANKGTYVKYIVCYYPGDAKTDGKLDICDLIAIKKFASNVDLSTKAAKAAADSNRDGKVDTNDSADLRTKLVTSVGIEETKDTFLSYEDGVMPIAGFYGPYRYTDKYGKSYDLITDEVYQKLADAKINLINYYAADYRDSADDVLDNLVLAEKYNLGVYVTDSRINGNMTVANLAKRLAGYMQYQSFKGILIVDEPNTDSYNNAKDGEILANKLAGYVPQAMLLNRFSNTIGYMNLLPLREGLNKTDNNLEVAYQAYIDEYLTTNGKLLSWDYYVWDHNTIPSAYFTNLSMMRNNAIENQIPFWSYIQAGSNWNDSRVDLEVTDNTVPSKAQILWNVNTSLAYGAKGIQYFPLVQPAYFAYENSDENYDYDRNGLIDAEGNTNDWYDYVTEANTQIETVDEYLMYANSEAVLAVGAAQKDTGITATAYDSVIQSISADHGAVVGVFQYGQQKLLYVVNYDVSAEGEDNITLNFEDAMTYEVISNQQKVDSSVLEGTSQNLTLSLVNGGAALVVLN